MADPVHADWVNHVGDGVPLLNKNISLQHLTHFNLIEEAADFLFSTNILSDLLQTIQHSYLSLFNLRVDEFNYLMMRHISGVEGK
jgi:hypothetical protein